jgi:hypothetical protein
MELLLETGLLKLLVPELEAWVTNESSDELTVQRKARFWAYLGALDRSTARRGTPPSNALELATVLFPALRDALHPDTNAIRDIGQHVVTAIRPVLDRLKASRRDADLARQILLAMRYIFPSSNPNRKRPRLAGREFLDDALRLHEIVSDADAAAPDLAGQPLLVDGEVMAPRADDDNPPELESLIDVGQGRRGRGRDRTARPAATTVASQPQATTGWTAPAATAHGLTPIPALAVMVPAPPGFLGTGAFGGRWSGASD